MAARCGDSGSAGLGPTWLPPPAAHLAPAGCGKARGRASSSQVGRVPALGPAAPARRSGAGSGPSCASPGAVGARPLRGAPVPQTLQGVCVGGAGGSPGPVPPVRWGDDHWPGRGVSTQAGDVCSPRLQKRKSDKNRRPSSTERERDSGNRMAEVKVIVSGHLRQLSCDGLSPLGGLRGYVWVLTGDVVKITGPSPLWTIS